MITRHGFPEIIGAVRIFRLRRLLEAYPVRESAGPNSSPQSAFARRKACQSNSRRARREFQMTIVLHLHTHCNDIVMRTWIPRDRNLTISLHPLDVRSVTHSRQTPLKFRGSI